MDHRRVRDDWPPRVVRDLDGQWSRRHGPLRTLIVAPTFDAAAVAASLKCAGAMVDLIPEVRSAVSLLNRYDVAVVDLDGNDEGLLSLIESAQALQAPIGVVAMVSDGCLDRMLAAIKAGAGQCVVKPAAPDVVCLECFEAHRRARAVTRRLDEVHWLRVALEEVDQELVSVRADFLKRSVAAFEALTATLEAKDPHMVGHSLRVAHMAGAIAEEMGCSEAEAENVRLAGRLHDIGMIGVPSQITRKPSALTPEERQVVRGHVALAGHILGPFEMLREVRRYIEGHHERMDGEGYPNGVPAATLPLGARILAAAEIFDALISPRAHRSELGAQEALEYLENMAGSAVDPTVCRALRSLVDGQRLLMFLTDRPDRFVESGVNDPDSQHGDIAATPRILPLPRRASPSADPSTVSVPSHPDAD